MMRYIDSGDDVGVALSPQLMFNVVPDCDIFNHQNVHFWEMMQPGMDALGFISLTGERSSYECLKFEVEVDELEMCGAHG
jgi:hypothetical protein